MNQNIKRPTHIETIHEKVSFSNYEIVVDKKFEKNVLIFNDVLAKALNIDEQSSIYHFEFIYNKELFDNQYIIHMDSKICHVEISNKKALEETINLLIELFMLNNKLKAKKITSKAYYIENNIKQTY